MSWIFCWNHILAKNVMVHVFKHCKGSCTAYTQRQRIQAADKWAQRLMEPGKLKSFFLNSTFNLRVLRFLSFIFPKS